MYFSPQKENFHFFRTLRFLMSHRTDHKNLFKFLVWFWQARLQGSLKLGFWCVCFKTVFWLCCGFLVFCFFLKASDSWPVKCFLSLHLVSIPFIISLTTATMFSEGKKPERGVQKATGIPRWINHTHEVCKSGPNNITCTTNGGMGRHFETSRTNQNLIEHLASCFHFLKQIIGPKHLKLKVTLCEHGLKFLS